VNLLPRFERMKVMEEQVERQDGRHGHRRTGDQPDCALAHSFAECPENYCPCERRENDGS
jgi:hypothetical protein